MEAVGGLALVASGMLGCSSGSATSGDGGAPTEASATDGALNSDGGVTSVDGQAEGGCVHPANAAPTIRFVLDDGGTAPPLSGGTIASGTYYATSSTIFGSNIDVPCTTAGLKETLVVNATSPTSGSIEAVRQVDIMTSFGATFTSSGTMFTLSDACPASYNANWWPYTATPTQLTFSYGHCFGTEVDVFTKQ